MPTYQYKARKLTGELETGSLEAPDQDVLISLLQEKGLIVLGISKKEKASPDSSSGKTYKIKLHNNVNTKDLILFARQLATTLKANIPLLKCLEIQFQQTTSRRLKTALGQIMDDVKQGHTLKDSLAKHPKIFPAMWVHLVETGEASGQLPAILYQLGEYLEAANELKRKTITAFIYPGLLITVAILGIYIFTVKIIPIFEGIFKDFGMELPLLTNIVIWVSRFLRKYILHTIIVFGVAGYFIKRYINTEEGRRIFDSLKFKIPIFGEFILNSCIEKFSSSLGLLLNSGIPILQALEIVTKTASNKIIQDALISAHTDVREGKPLSASLGSTGVFPPLPLSMCSVGEETGDLSKMLEQVSDYYISELTIFVERLSVALEPLVIITMGGIIGVLVFAMYLPIFKIAMLG